MEHIEIGFPIRRDRFHKREKICNTAVVDRTGIKVRRERNPGKRSVATVASTIDRDPLGIGNALLYQPLNAIADIILHRFAPLMEGSFPEFFAIAGRAAEIDLQDAITTIRKELNFRIVAPTIPRPRSSMRIDNDG